MIQFSLKELDTYNFQQHKIPDAPKYHGLNCFMDYLNQNNNGQMNRNNFGQNTSKKYFQISDTVDNLIKCRINELMSKITENNKDEILEQFKKISFANATDYKMIAQTIHNGIINCYKYHLQFLPLIEYLNNNTKPMQPFLKEVFLNYSYDKIKQLDDLQEESKFIAKKQLQANYEMMVLLYKRGVIVEYKDIENIINKFQLDSNLTATTIEIFIRFLLILNQKKVHFDQSIIESLNQRVKTGNYPRMIGFLMMDFS